MNVHNNHVFFRHQIEIAGGLGPSVGKVWRIGVMGHNANPENVKRTLNALEEGIKMAQTPQIKGTS